MNPGSSGSSTVSGYEGTYPVMDGSREVKAAEFKRMGVFYWNGYKHTFYNLNMNGCVNIMRDLGYSEDEYPYWVRNDGVKMFGKYVMVAADLSLHPKGSVVATAVGQAMVVDTGTFAETTPQQYDVAVNW